MDVKDKKRTAQPKMTDCEVLAWLEACFEREETILCERLREDAAALGISKRQLKDARQCLGIKTWHQFDEGGATENWFWTRNVGS